MGSIFNGKNKYNLLIDIMDIYFKSLDVWVVLDLKY